MNTMWQFVNSIFAKILRDDIGRSLRFDIYAMKISLIQHRAESGRENATFIFTALMDMTAIGTRTDLFYLEILMQNF